ENHELVGIGEASARFGNRFAAKDKVRGDDLRVEAELLRFVPTAPDFADDQGRFGELGEVERFAFVCFREERAHDAGIDAALKYPVKVARGQSGGVIAVNGSVRTDDHEVRD